MLKITTNPKTFVGISGRSIELNNTMKKTAKVFKMTRKDREYFIKIKKKYLNNTEIESIYMNQQP